MGNYSYDDLQAMQERALERVRQMQDVSRHAAADFTAQSENLPAQTVAEPERTEPPTPPPKTGRISMPLNLPQKEDPIYPDFATFFGAENQKEQEKTKVREKANRLDTLLSEPDAALTLALLLLLQTEHADESLQLALLYILS